ncbi:hypothetical protein ACFY2R_13015 [Micromonospora olivasterospora]|uniref:Protein phosphatase 2C-like protein n=1 Tax=Micromonospora olivasterospora TaxID=1880 RepID=A0A562IBC3_MICOL|nr:hypothetical protein [Micromonospora olivasterospora]TWH67934.1 hypothetical protein JD77_02920 [Micromonospora olivasterospora]
MSPGYTRRLGGALLGRLSRGDGRDLAAILAATIDETADEHRGTCDITHPASPQATVAIVRAHRDRLDYFLLADSFLVLDQVRGGPQVSTDEREVTARRVCSAPLDGVPTGSPEYDRIRESCVEALRARRNRLLDRKDDPRAAEEAVTGSRPIHDLASVTLLSNGARRIVSPYGLTDWPGVLELLGAGGPADIIRRVRDAEALVAGGPDARLPDDATVAHCTHLPRSEAGELSRPAASRRDPL